MRIYRLLPVVTIASFLLTASSSGPGIAQPYSPAGSGIYQPSPGPCIDGLEYQRLVEAGRLARPPAPGLLWPEQVQFPSYAWPLERGLRDGYIMVNYVDHDPTAAIKDYSNGAWAYDGHTGTDITLYNFRLMDRGYRILSAAPGTVSSVVYNKEDRHTGPPYAATENNVVVTNNDGTSTWYIHLRTNAVTVNPGEVIPAGTLIGLVGSSGNSTDAHLHFECGQYTPSWVTRDPWNGPNNALPSLWASQLPYVGAQHLWIADMGVFTQAAAGGDLNNFPFPLFKERFIAPVVMGANEPWIPVFLQLQGLAGDAYRIEILRPNSTLYAFVDYTLPSNNPYSWHYWYWGWSGGVPPSDYGTWAVRVLINSVEVKRTTFQVGASTIFGPRLVPKAGHTFRLDGTTQRDTMHVSPLGSPVSYSLLSHPSGITLADSIVTIASTFSQNLRSLYFQAVARDAAGRADTMWYHIVDPTKPLGEQTAVDAGPARVARLALAPASPNPAGRSTVLRFSCAAGQHVNLSIYDAAGRRVRTLLDGLPRGGEIEHAVSWDGRDGAGLRVPAGLYFARIRAGLESRSSKVALLN